MTRVQALCEVLAEEALRASQKIDELSNRIPLLVSQATRELENAADENVERLKALYKNMVDAAKAMEELAQRVSEGLSATQLKLEFYIQESNRKILQDTMDFLNTQAVALAVNAARTALAADLGQLSRDVVAVTRQLQEVLEKETKRASRLGWANGLKIATVVALSTMTVLIGDRLVQRLLPGPLSELHLQYLARGQALTAIWPKLDLATRKTINLLEQEQESTH